jgi:ATP-dependent Clp protease adaptor protein ClpS
MASTNSETKGKTASKFKDDNPSMYRVILHNDDYTTMDFVVEILINVFRKSLEKATQIMLNIHNKGKEVCGIYPRQIAETKIEIVHNLSVNKGFPLRSTMEKE